MHATATRVNQRLVVIDEVLCAGLIEMDRAAAFLTAVNEQQHLLKRTRLVVERMCNER